LTCQTHVKYLGVELDQSLTGEKWLKRLFVNQMPNQNSCIDKQNMST